jgi:hypothetical protein
MIASIDFMFKFKLAFGEEAVPEIYELEEVAHRENADQPLKCTLLGQPCKRAC